MSSRVNILFDICEQLLEYAEQNHVGTTNTVYFDGICFKLYFELELYYIELDISIRSRMYYAFAEFINNVLQLNPKRSPPESQIYDIVSTIGHKFKTIASVVKFALATDPDENAGDNDDSDNNNSEDSDNSNSEDGYGSE